MDDLRLNVRVDASGVVQAQRLDNHAVSPSGPVAYEGLDAEVLSVFESLLADPRRRWTDRELRVVGSLLHRCLFPDSTWNWVENVLARCREQEQVVRLELTFPDKAPFSRLGAIPWEYLFRPETSTERGYFLAADRGLVLSRYIPSERGERERTPSPQPWALVVVSDPDPDALGPVLPDETLAAVEEAAGHLGFSVQVLRDPDALTLHKAVHREATPPELVHILGHGQFDVERGEASLALRADTGGVDWVSEHRLTEILVRGRRAPRAVILHSCELGAADYTSSFAGMAPQLVRAGVDCVIAMQYPVQNRTAISFARSLYEQLGSRTDLDKAVQEARWSLSAFGAQSDPWLLGVPVIYLQNRTALLPGGPDGGV